MSEDAPLRNRLRTDLMDNQSVTLTAIGLGLVAFVLVSLDSSPLPVSSDFSAEFLLSLSLMDVAFVIAVGVQFGSAILYARIR